MGQISSRHRPEDPSSPHSTLSSTQSSSTRIADDSLPASTQQPSNSRLLSSHHNSDLSHQPLPPKRNPRKSFLGTLRSPLPSRWKPQRTPSNEADVTRASNTHKRWTFDRRRRKTSEPARRLTQYSEPPESQQLGEPSSRGRLSSAPSPPLSGPATTDPKGKAKENDPSASISDLPTTPTVGPSSSGSSTTDASRSNVMPLQSTATDISSPSSAPSSASPPRDLLALNHDPSSISTAPFQPDDTPGRTHDDSEPFNVMERPATPPDASQPPPLPEARRNFPAAGTLVVVQGVVQTSDVSQSAAPEPTEQPTPRRASSVPPLGERPQRRRFSDLLSRPIRSRRSSYAAPESQSSESNASADSDNREESSPTSDPSQQSPTQEELPVSASRPLSLSPTSIDVLGTLLSVATAATAASLVSGTSEPLLNSSLGLPSSPGVQGSQQQQQRPQQQQPTPSPSPIPLPIPDQTPTQNPTQGQNQGQSRPLSPTPTAGLASRDRVRNAWAGLRDRLGFRRPSPVSSAISPPPEPEPIPSAPPVIQVDPRTQLLADMARAFQMGMGLEDGSGSGSRSAGPPSPAIEVNLGDGQQQQQQTQQQERPPPTEDSFDRFLMDLQADLRRTLEEGQPETEPTPEQEQEVEPVGVGASPLIYPQDLPLSTDGGQSASEDLDFGDLPALPPDDDDFPHLDEAVANVPDIGDHRQSEGETVTLSPSVPSPPASASQPPQTPMRRTVTGSERRPGGGINWWRMYRFPPMIVPHGTPSTIPSPASPLPPPTTTPPASAADVGAPPGERGPPSPSVDTQTQTQDGNTVVPVIVVGLQSVHGYGHGHWHRHADGRNEHPPQPERQQDVGAGQDSDRTQEDDVPAGPSESPRDRERRWSTRAADAFRGLRPAHGTGPTRRDGTGSSSTEASTRPSDDGHGSTTFFIYVIGGYYPPNHQLVIGTDPLDSFEELAELLGQAKPQTASKEEIDNSGLEVIRVGMLTDYEKAGRVAPMCVDRCLICLEEYNAEEDLRLLSCRHVFHKDCVDRWLETGRNNCPACRTQGVSTSEPIPIPSS